MPEEAASREPAAAAPEGRWPRPLLDALAADARILGAADLSEAG